MTKELRRLCPTRGNHEGLVAQPGAWDVGEAGSLPTRRGSVNQTVEPTPNWLST